MPTKDELVEIISSNVDVRRFKEQHWEGNFWDYLDLVAKNPSVARNSFQRLYDMILHFGAERYTVCREDYVRYHFFADPIDHGADAIFGLDKPLMNLVDFFRSAAYGYGTEKRILLLHGPVGSSKSTIARLLKKGLEYYSALEDGALYTFSWKVKDKHGEMQRYECPMHEEPLKLIPYEARPAVLEKLNADLPENQRIRIEGHLNPFSRKMFEDLMRFYDGDWEGDGPRRRSASARAEREGPRRHRHLPAQGREEPGLAPS
jgi:serine protein kinase